MFITNNEVHCFMILVKLATFEMICIYVRMFPRDQQRLTAIEQRSLEVVEELRLGGSGAR